MHVLVVGAAGMLGGKLVERLFRDRRVGESSVTRLTLVDAVTPAVRASDVPFPVDSLCGSFGTIFNGFREIAGDNKALFHDNAIRIYGMNQ